MTMASKSFSVSSRYHLGSCRARCRRTFSQGCLGLKSSRKIMSPNPLSDGQLMVFSNAVDECVRTEENFIRDLEELLMLLHHPGLQGNVLSLHEFIRNVKDLLTVHKTLKQDLTSNMCSIACAFFNFMPYMTFYLDYCCFLKRIHHSIEKVIGLCEKELYVKCAELLQAPILHISKYETMLIKLKEVASECEKAPIQEIQDAVKKTVRQMTAICKSTENALKMHWIQKCLVDRQPKIFTPGRLLLRNGTLLKMQRIRQTPVERVLLLFNDILLYCKKVKKCDDFYKRSSLKCSVVILLLDCSVMLVRQPKLGIDQPMLKICWHGHEYLLFSKFVGVAQSWLDAIRQAIKSCKECASVVHSDSKRTGTSIKRATVICKKSQYLPSASLKMQINENADNSTAVLNKC